jgi:hypothetical protein
MSHLLTRSHLRFWAAKCILKVNTCCNLERLSQPEILCRLSLVTQVRDIDDYYSPISFSIILFSKDPLFDIRQQFVAILYKYSYKGLSSKYLALFLFLAHEPEKELFDLVSVITFPDSSYETHAL